MNDNPNNDSLDDIFQNDSAPADFNRLRIRAEIRLRQREKFLRSAFIFGVFVLITLGGLINGIPWTPWVLIGLAFWGMSLFRKFRTLYDVSLPGLPSREEQIQREMQREMAQSLSTGISYEKPKRGLPPLDSQQSAAKFRLGDDGELIPVEDVPKRKNDASNVL